MMLWEIFKSRTNTEAVYVLKEERVGVMKTVYNKLKYEVKLKKRRDATKKLSKRSRDVPSTCTSLNLVALTFRS